jgi:3-deoxy-manno-octulosonate cytidylyltransferase (CMP-KDO synthetase)
VALCSGRYDEIHHADTPSAFAMTDFLDFVVAIPARYAASRLPGKPLRLLGGEPLVLHVARRALAAGAREVWVATDDDRIAAALDGSGVRIAMTSLDHASGTDRVAECAEIAAWGEDQVVVNLQGDEPFAPAAGIRTVAEILVASGAAMSTLAVPIDDAGTLFDPNAVKLVRAAKIQGVGDAFARDRDALPSGGPWLRHIGIYGYRAGFLRHFASLPPSSLEIIESLEQLRALEGGHRIAVALTPAPFPPGIDTPEDLERAERTLAALGAEGDVR